MESPTTNRPCFVCHDENCKYRGMSPYVCMRDMMKNKLEQAGPTLKERLTEFAKKAAKEAHDNEDIQKLAEGCIWIGAIWLARACNIKGVKDDGLASSKGGLIKDIVENSKPMPPEFAQLVNDNFWDMVD